MTLILDLAPWRGSRWTSTLATEASMCALSGLPVKIGDEIYVSEEPALVGESLLAVELKQHITFP